MNELFENITTIIKGNNNFLKANFETNICTSLNLGHDVSITERINLSYCNNDRSYKFVEFTKWGQNNKIAVAIGFNPATKDANEMDITNKKITYTLHKRGYDGYILLNLNVQVSKNKKAFSTSNAIDANYCELLPEILKFIINNNTDILIFWGRTVKISKDIKDLFIENLKNNHNIFKTIKKGTQKHYHPAYVQIDICNISPQDFTVGKKNIYLK